MEGSTTNENFCDGSIRASLLMSERIPSPVVRIVHRSLDNLLKSENSFENITVGIGSNMHCLPPYLPEMTHPIFIASKEA